MEAVVLAVANAPIVIASVSGLMTPGTLVTGTGLPACAPSTKNVTVPVGPSPPLFVLTVAARAVPRAVTLVAVDAAVMVKVAGADGELALKLGSPL